jgi:hypothetical protein
MLLNDTHMHGRVRSGGQGVGAWDEGDDQASSPETTDPDHRDAERRRMVINDRERAAKKAERERKEREYEAAVRDSQPAKQPAS